MQMHRPALRGQPVLHGEHRRQQLPQHPLAGQPRGLLSRLRVHLPRLYGRHARAGLGGFGVRSVGRYLREVQDLHRDHRWHVPVDKTVA